MDTLTIILLFVVAAIVGWTLFAIHMHQRRQNQPSTIVGIARSIWNGIKYVYKSAKDGLESTKQGYRSMKERVSKLYFPDLHFNPITWNLVFRPIASLIAGGITASGVKLVFWSLFQLGLLPVDPISGPIMIAIMAVVFLAVVRPEYGQGETVPPTDYGALVTFIGMPIPVIRTSGDYGWLGRRIWFDRSRKLFTGVSMPVGNEDDANNPLNLGFIPLGDITFQVWNSSHAETKEEKTKLIRPAKNRSPVTGSLTLIGYFPRPRLWLKAVDPALDIGDRARQEYQELITTLVDTDVANVQPMLQDYLFGKTIFTAFLTNITKPVQGHKKGAMIRNRPGLVMYHVVEDDEDQDEARDAFVSKLKEDADPKMLKAISYKGQLPDGTQGTLYAISTLKVSDPLHKVTRERGLKMTRVTFGDIILADKVSAAAEQASAETDERNSQIASAKTNREARQHLQPTDKELENSELYQLTTVLQAAADDKTGNIRVVMVPGADRLGSSIVAAGQQIGGNK